MHISKQLNKNNSSCFSYDFNKVIISLIIIFFVLSSIVSKFFLNNKYKPTIAPNLTFFNTSFDNSNNLLIFSFKLKSPKYESNKPKTSFNALK